MRWRVEKASIGGCWIAYAEDLTGAQLFRTWRAAHRYAMAGATR